MISPVSTSEAPAALGHYSQAIQFQNFVFVSGQLPLDPKNPDAPLGSIQDQVRQTLENVQAVLLAAGSDKSQVVKATIFMTDLALWPEINRVYGEFFGAHKPARSAVPISTLPKNCLVEIEVIAVKN